MSILLSPSFIAIFHVYNLKFPTLSISPQSMASFVLRKPRSWAFRVFIVLLPFESQGPLFKELVSGNSITVNNRVITSDMVMTSASRGPSVFLLNAHSKDVALSIEQTFHSIIEF